jgi:hypothetical protein
MKSLWTPWTLLIIVIFALGLAILNGIIDFDAPNINVTGNDIRPPVVRSFRINGVRVGDVIAVIDSVVLTPAELEDPGSMATGNTISFDADISDENRIVQATLTLFQLLPLPKRPAPYADFDLLEAAYRLEWDASDAPNGLYGVSIRVIDEHQNEATVYPNVQLALLRFGEQAATAPQAPATDSTDITPGAAPATTTSAPAATPADPSSPSTATPSPTPSTPSSSTPLSNPAATPTNPTPAATTPTNGTLRRRDWIFGVSTTGFIVLLVVAVKLFVSRWSR